MLMDERGEQGEAFRWLILSSMLQQQGKSATESARLMFRAHNSDLDEGDVSSVTATLHGW
jgi:hypothetical protein